MVLQIRPLALKACQLNQAGHNTCIGVRIAIVDTALESAYVQKSETLSKK